MIQNKPCGYGAFPGHKCVLNKFTICIKCDKIQAKEREKPGICGSEQIVFSETERGHLSGAKYIFELEEMEEKTMSRLNSFIELLTGKFNNSEQYEDMEKKGKDFPYAEHVNTVCNHKIVHLPEDFKGIFLVEESYYTTNGKTHSSNHLFLFTEEEDGILLTSYEVPEGYAKDAFTYENLSSVDYADLKRSEKFTPALYVEKNGVWEGGSTSMFSPVLKFTLLERFSKTCLEVTETMEVNGKKTFGYDEPIIYKRVSK